MNVLKKIGKYNFMEEGTDKIGIISKRGLGVFRRLIRSLLSSVVRTHSVDVLQFLVAGLHYVLHL